MLDAGILGVGTAWIAEHGEGPARSDQRESLRTALLSEFKALGIQEGDAVCSEVGRFVDTARVSRTNLSRLARRVARSDFGCGAMTARAGSTIEGSISRPETVLSNHSVMSARGKDQGPESITLQPVHERQRPQTVQVHTRGESGGQESSKYNTWAAVAQHAQRMELWETEQKLQAQKRTQLEMSKYLKAQMAVRERNQKAAIEIERASFRHQEADIDRWLAAESAHVAVARSRAMDVRREHEAQKESTERAREEARHKRIEEEQLQAARNTKAIIEEEQKAAEKKQQNKIEMSKMYNEWLQTKASKGDQRRARLEEERETLRQYQDMMDLREQRAKSEARSKARPIRDELSLVDAMLDKRTRRQEERNAEVSLAQKQMQANLLSNKADEREQERRKADRESHKVFLFKQIEERTMERNKAFSQKAPERAVAQADTAEFVEAERNRNAERRMKHVQHRLDLQQQIEQKKEPPDKDMMSAAELAINRQLLKEAEDLRARLESGKSSM